MTVRRSKKLKEAYENIESALVELEFLLLAIEHKDPLSQLKFRCQDIRNRLFNTIGKL